MDSQLMFIVEQYDTLFGTLGGRWISFSGIAAAVDAEGYQSLRVPLSRHFGESWDLPGDPLPLVTVELERTGSTPRHEGDAEKRKQQE